MNSTLDNGRFSYMHIVKLKRECLVPFAGNLVPLFIYKNHQCFQKSSVIHLRPEAFVRRTDYFQASLFHTSPATLSEVKTIKCPPFAESITEGDVRWEVEVGDTVAEDQVGSIFYRGLKARFYRLTAQFW